jgi:hypothetical protein
VIDAWTTAAEPVASEGGIVVRDEVHPEGARVTLERDGRTAPWSITCGIYGLMVHTVFCADEPSARSTYDALKADIVRILRLPVDEMAHAVGVLVEKY